MILGEAYHRVWSLRLRWSACCDAQPRPRVDRELDHGGQRRGAVSQEGTQGKIGLGNLVDIVARCTSNKNQCPKRVCVTFYLCFYFLRIFLHLCVTAVGSRPEKHVHVELYYVVRMSPNCDCRTGKANDEIGVYYLVNSLSPVIPPAPARLSTSNSVLCLILLLVIRYYITDLFLSSGLPLL